MPERLHDSPEQSARGPAAAGHLRASSDRRPDLCVPLVRTPMIRRSNLRAYIGQPPIVRLRFANGSVLVFRGGDVEPILTAGTTCGVASGG